MDNIVFDYWNIKENNKCETLAKLVLLKCLQIENLENKNFVINIIYTNSEEMRKINYKYRNIDKETDVLSFPMFDKLELDYINEEFDILGDIVISIEQVEKQAKEYGHSFERELSYMVVHGFYHLIGYDHIKEEDKVVMRKKEENILKLVEINK